MGKEGRGRGRGGGGGGGGGGGTSGVSSDRARGWRADGVIYGVGWSDIPPLLAIQLYR